MNKADLIEAVAKRTKTSATGAEYAVNAVMETIYDTLEDGEAVKIVGFGTFKVRQTKARNGRNPQTGKAIKIKATKRVKFTAGAALRAAVK